MQFGLHLVRSGALSAEDFVAVVERQLRERPPLGTLAIECHKLSMKQLFAVLEAQADEPLPFGQLAVQLGFMSPMDVFQLIGLQSERSRPIAEHVLEMGLVASDVLREEMQRFHAGRRGHGAVATEDEREAGERPVVDPAAMVCCEPFGDAARGSADHVGWELVEA